MSSAVLHVTAVDSVSFFPENSLDIPCLDIEVLIASSVSASHRIQQVVRSKAVSGRSWNFLYSVEKLYAKLPDSQKR